MIHNFIRVLALLIGVAGFAASAIIWIFNLLPEGAPENAGAILVWCAIISFIVGAYGIHGDFE